MDTSPFPHQGPLLPDEVRGRDALIVDLTENVTSGIVTALLGPRRYGKTSVLRRLAADLAEVTTIWVDLYGATSVLDVALRFDAALDESSGPFRVAARLQAQKLSLNLGAVRVEMARPQRDRPEPIARLQSLLDVLIAASLSTPTLLVLDEFSSVVDAGNTTALLRTKLQHHYRDIGIVFAGSEPSTMRMLFSARSQPFFGQATIVEIEPLSPAAVSEIVQDGFNATGRDAGVAPERILALTEGHPQRSMQAAHAVWWATPPGQSATDEDVSMAVNRMRSQVDGEMHSIFNRHPTGAQQVLRLIAHGLPIYGSRAGAIDLAKNTATHSRDVLLADGHLRIDESNRLCVTDPMFADWLRGRFPL